MKKHGIPLYALESFRPVRTFDVVAFSLQYEMLYTNVLAMLDLAGIPLESAHRTPDDPIVIAGGPCAACPEPVADFIDVIFPGDGEEVIAQFAEIVRECKKNGLSREEIILEAARRMPSAYVPAHYSARYAESGTFAGLEPQTPDIPKVVRAAKLESLREAWFPTGPIVPFIETVHDRITLEIMRGCTRGCRYCQAGMLRRPVRPRSPERLVEVAREAYRQTGYNEIALTSLSSSDYPQFQELLKQMNAFAEPLGISLSVSSLRINDQLKALPESLSRVRKSGLTVAPEAGTERLRHVINKNVTDEELLEGVAAAFSQGWRRVKLYFMIGLPTETDEDVAAIVDLSERVSRKRREAGGGLGNVNVSIAPFVPKPHTPFQWEGMATVEELAAKKRLILQRAKLRSVQYKFHDAQCSQLEAALARGDRRIGRVLLRVYKAGAQFDAWREHFDYERWLQAFKDEGLDAERCATRPRALDEALPWEHIDFGLTRDFLVREREKSRRGEFTPDCRTGNCSLCGVCASLLART
jgi:radical SAM family uncharacterized protein